MNILALCKKVKPSILQKSPSPGTSEGEVEQLVLPLVLLQAGQSEGEGLCQLQIPRGYAVTALLFHLKNKKKKNWREKRNSMGTMKTARLREDFQKLTKG